VLQSLGRGEEALGHARHAYELVRAFGDSHPDVLYARRGIAMALLTIGRRSDAVAEFRALLALNRSRFGDDHPQVAYAHADLANALTSLGRHAEVATEYQAALVIRERLAPDSAETMSSRSGLAGALVALGRDAEAEPLLRRVVEEQARRLGPDHPDLARAYRDLGAALIGLGRHREALEWLEKARAVYTAHFGDHSADAAQMFLLEAEAMWKHGKRGEAERLAERGYTIDAEALPVGDPIRVQAANAFAFFAMEAGDRRRALALAEEALAAASSAQDPAGFAEAQFGVAQLLWSTGGDRRRAVDLIRAASRSPDESMRRDAEAWLAEHAPPAPPSPPRR
jgi:tetratricopeptide (TPR) repeat protein